VYLYVDVCIYMMHLEGNSVKVIYNIIRQYYIMIYDNNNTII